MHASAIRRSEDGPSAVLVEELRLRDIASSCIVAPNRGRHEGYQMSWQEYSCRNVGLKIRHRGECSAFGVSANQWNIVLSDGFWWYRMQIREPFHILGARFRRLPRLITSEPQPRCEICLGIGYSRLVPISCFDGQIIAARPPPGFYPGHNADTLKHLQPRPYHGSSKHDTRQTSRS